MADRKDFAKRGRDAKFVRLAVPADRRGGQELVAAIGDATPVLSTTARRTARRRGSTDSRARKHTRAKLLAPGAIQQSGCYPTGAIAIRGRGSMPASAGRRDPPAVVGVSAIPAAARS